MTTPARLIKVENRLGELITQPGGRTLRDALAQADRRVKVKLGELAKTLPAATAQLGDLVEAAADGRAGGLDRIYDASNQVFALAGALGYAGLAAAAYSLCDLIDGFRESGRPSWDAIRVHVDAIRLMGAKPVADHADEAIASGLKALGAHFNRPPNP